jgi:hypothetical protein
VAKTGLIITVRIDGAKETIRAFNALPKNVNRELRDRTKELATIMAQSAKDAGIRQGRQAALVARSVKVQRDRVPAVVAGGGSPPLGRHGAPPSALLFGSEFGMNVASGWFHQSRFFKDWSHFQYHEHTGQTGAWFFPTVERMAPEIGEAWNKVADDIVRSLVAGG